MNPNLLCRLLSLLLLLAGVLQFLPALIAWVYDDSSFTTFILSGSGLLLIGAAAWWPARRVRIDLRLRDGFLVVALSWIVIGLAGALPIVMLKVPQVGVVDAIFESVSGLTTTGATVLIGLEAMPPGLLFHRALLQWLGGMGIVVLAVAVLPMLRIGGLQLYRAEMPGPVKDSKLTPRIADTAKALWTIYFSLTLLCMLAYHVAGMSWFDAVTHAFTTLSTGGYSNYDASIAHFQSLLIELIAIVFMTLGGINFAIHFLAWRRASLVPYQQDPEVRTYMTLLLVFAAIATAAIVFYGVEPHWPSALRLGLFQAVSTMTSTGYTTAGFYLWPGFLPIFFIFIVFIGGCAGSTGGGMKVIRIMLLYKQAVSEIQRVIHPASAGIIRIGSRAVESRVITAVWGYFFIYVASFAILSVLLNATGLDLETSFSAVATCLTNLGPSLGVAGPHFADLNAVAKSVLVFAMLLGRLEIFTLLVLLTPAYWKDA